MTLTPFIPITQAARLLRMTPYHLTELGKQGRFTLHDKRRPGKKRARWYLDRATFTKLQELRREGDWKQWIAWKQK